MRGKDTKRAESAGTEKYYNHIPTYLNENLTKEEKKRRE